jgi:large subunit ribosomal protein L21
LRAGSAGAHFWFVQPLSEAAANTKAPSGKVADFSGSKKRRKTSLADFSKPQDQALPAAPQGAKQWRPGYPGTRMTFAVIKTGGKQYKVAANDVVKIEKIAGEPGDVVTFDQVLLVGEGDNVTIGAPLVNGALVAGQFIATEKERTVIILKKERRQHYDRRNGHRQRLSTVRITEILTGGAKPTTKVDEIAKARYEKKLAALAATSTASVTEAPKAAAKPAAAKKAAPKKAAAEAEAPAAEAKAPAKKAAPKKTETKAAAAADTADKPAKKPAAKKAAPKADKE